MASKKQPSLSAFSPSTKSNAFTIVELLVVIVVIGILAAITIVSYSGITNRATISSLQSDLTNASTTLKLDQIINSAFPATLALANNGKGITQSQSLDSIIYIPDNTSNPNNFCLQYRKGTNTYAVDNNSPVSSGACLQNLVSNGDFSNGTTGWTNSGIPTITTDSSLGRPSLKFVANGNNPYYVKNISSDQSHYWYTKLECYISSYTSGGVSALDVRNSIQTVYANPLILNQWQTLSIITTGKTGGVESVFVGSANSLVTATFYISNVSTIDLTAAFGSGNEPTKAQMDTIMSTYPNSWFNITAKANL